MNKRWGASEFRPVLTSIAVTAAFAVVVATAQPTDPAAASPLPDSLPAPGAPTWSTETALSTLTTPEAVSEVLSGEGETLPTVPGEVSEYGVHVPTSLDEPVTVTDENGDELTLELPTEDGAEISVTDAGDVVVPSENVGADLLLQQIDPATVDGLAAGVRTVMTIDSWDVEPLFEFSPEVPEGGSIDFDETGAVVVYTAEGEISSIVAEPWAVDANGAEVPTWFEIEDDKLFQYVDHVAGDYAYPVVADPAWFIPLVLIGGRLIIQRVVAASAAAARTAAVRTAAGSRIANYRSFTASNYRWNYIIASMRDPGTRCDAHHTLPQKYRARFSSIGFTGNDSIDHPKYIVWWEYRDHRAKAGAYNNEWGAWLAGTPRATKTQTLSKRTEMVRKYRAWC